ncbi:MAG: methyltransferase domain-containing protein, partial [Candidatus Zixiibacteriota bacterium]
EFLKEAKRRYPPAFKAKKILECGSYDINGSPRGMFPARSEYIGIDHRAGPGVDEVALAHSYRSRPDGYFETVISTEMLEHDPYWAWSLARMAELVAPGGYLILTTAGPARKPHEIYCAPLEGYYRNLTLGEIISSVMACCEFGIIWAEMRRGDQDLCCLFGDKR